VQRIPYGRNPGFLDRTFFIYKLKTAMIGKRFEAVLLIQQTVTRELKTIQEEEFSQAFDSLHERCKLCAEVSGDYSERQF
jgi:hypothetical protein